MCISGKDTPAITNRLIGPDSKEEECNYPWDYRSVIGKLNFSEKSTRPDISYTVHQCTHFMSNPKKSHGEAIKCIGQYLLDT